MLLGKKRYILGLGVCSFVFFFVLTYNISFFWDDAIFLDGVFSHSYKQLFMQTMTLGTLNFSHPGLPLTLLLLKFVGVISGINALWFRALHALFFAATIVFLFLFLQEFNISRKRALIITGVAGFSYPLFLVAFFMSQAEIYGFAFQYAGLFLFFHTFFNQGQLSKKRFYLQLTLCALLFFIMLKLFSPSYFLIPALFLFICIYDYKRIKSYVLFFLLLFAVYFPLNVGIVKGDVGLYTLSVANIKHIFSFGETGSFFSFNNLYYKTLPEVLTPFGLITFFGLALLGVCYALKTLRKKVFKETCAFDDKEKAFILISLLSIGCSLLLLFAINDPAARYISFFIIPLTSIIVFFSFKSRDMVLQRYKGMLTLFMLFIMIMAVYNVGLSVLFRFTWGSGFMGMEKTADYLYALPGEKIVFYYSGSAADEYAPLRAQDGHFIPLQNIRYIKKGYNHKWDQAEVAKYTAGTEGTGEKDVYLIKRVTSSGRTSYPSYRIESLPNFKHVTTIYGENNFLDHLFLKTMQTFSFPYNYNQFEIYKYSKYP